MGRTQTKWDEMTEAGGDKKTNAKDHIFDIVIVGGGPSAMGLLRGLLEHISPPLGIHTRTAAAHASSFTICIIERGDADPWQGTGKEKGKGKEKESEKESEKETVPLRIQDPARWIDASFRNHSSYSTVHKSEPQGSLGHRILNVPIGKSLGGGTNINACLISQPVPTEPWPGLWKDGTRLLDASNALLDLMETGGGLQVVNMSEEYKRVCFNDDDDDDDKEARLENSRSSATNVKNAVQQTGTFPSLVLSLPTATTMTTNRVGSKHCHYQRVNYYDSLVKPFLQQHPGLVNQGIVTFYQGIQAERLVFQEEKGNPTNKITGVLCTHATMKQEQFVIHARKQVILSCGAFYSPALLLVSGIGHIQDLTQAGIAPANSNTSNTQMPVGRNLRDHVILPRHFFSTRPLSQSQRSVSTVQGFSNLDVTSSRDKNDTLRFQMMLCDATSLSQLLPHMVSLLFQKSYNTCVRRFFVGCVWTMLDILSKYTPLGFFLLHFTVGVNVCLLNPKSTGKVSVKPKQPKQPKQHGLLLSDFDLIINTGYLTDERDIHALEMGFHLTNTMFHKAFIEICPGHLLRSVVPRLLGYKADHIATKKEDETNNTHEQQHHREWLHQYIRYFATPYFHWCGTCTMGIASSPPSPSVMKEIQSKNSFVVNDRLVVQGFEGLRVCDASVFPTCMSGPTSLACASLGYAAAPMVIKNCIEKRQ